ncbi:MAG: hypothetical protein AB1779_03020 [Candidatus Thermoplasmatota archaeon]
MRTTINLRDDLYEILIKKAGSSRNLSKTINKFLSEHLIKERKIRMFGKFPELDKFVREEEELDRID